MCCNLNEEKSPGAVCQCERKKIEFVRVAREVLGELIEMSKGNKNALEKLQGIEETLKIMEGDDMK